MSLNVITGPVDSGKTTMMTRLYGSVGKGAGVITPKVFDTDGRLKGYDALVLPECLRVPLARVDCSPQFRHRGGRFYFSPEAFDRICESLCPRICDGPLWIDEIGPLEIAGGGFAPVLRKASEQEADVTACIRPALIFPVSVIFALPIRKIMFAIRRVR